MEKNIKSNELNTNSLSEFHNEMVEKIREIKGVFEVRELFENPNKYGDVASHISFRYNYIDRWNYSKGRIVFGYKNKQLFIPDKGYSILKKLNVPEIIKQIKNYYNLK